MTNLYPNCIVHTIDCAMDPKPFPRNMKTDRVKYHKICLSGKTFNQTEDGITRQFMTYTDLIRSIIGKGHHHVINALKMDIEGYEWDVMMNLVDSRLVLPHSISVELHYMSPNLWGDRLRSPFEIGAWMDYLFSRGGYMLVDRHDNVRCGHCSELVLAKLAKPLVFP